MSKITRAVFHPGSTTAQISGLSMYDYGQELEIHGLSLPREVAVEYSLNGAEPTIDRIGYTIDGVTTAAIPDNILSEQGNLKIYIRVLSPDSGQTEYTITGKVNYREKPSVQPEPGEVNPFGEAIRLTSEAADRAEDAEKSAESWAHGHEEYPERDKDNAEYYARVASENAGYAQDSLVEIERLASQVHSDADNTSQNTSLAAQYKDQAAQSAANALLSKQAAKTSETAAQEARTGAETAEEHAQLYAEQAATDKTSAESIKSEIDKTAQKITEDKNTVQILADDFAIAHQQAVTDVNNSGQAQTERVENTGESAVDEIEVARQQAVDSVSNEGELQKNAVKSEGDAQVSNVQAAAEEITGKVEQIDRNTQGIADLKGDLTNVNNTKAEQSDLAKTNLYLDTLYKLNKGQTYDVLEQDSKAYSVDVPSGAKYVGIDKVGGRSEVIDGEIVSSQTDRVDVASTDSTVTQQITTGFPVLNSAGSVYDYIDLNEGKLHQRVGVMDLGTIDWVQGGGNNKTSWVPDWWRTNVKPVESTGIKANILCSKYKTDISELVEKQMVDKSISVNRNGWVYIYDSAYISVTPQEFKTAMSGVMFHYELAKEVITDIEIPTELSEWLEVEAGGSITFHNSDEGKRLLIPNKETFIRKLDEVSV